MNKLAVNNFIVCMRKNVKQARVRIINKLVRDIRKLREKKGSDVRIQKNLRKVERLLQEIAVMKKINNDDISKYALLCSDDLPKLLSNDSISLEEKVKARFAVNKIMAIKVEEFRDLYPEWEIKLPVVLTQLGMQYRKKKKIKDSAENLSINVEKRSNASKLFRADRPNSLNKNHARNEEKTNSLAVQETHSISKNERGEECANYCEKKELSNSEELDKSQRFRFVLKNSDMESDDSDSENQNEESNNNIEQRGDPVKSILANLNDVEKRKKVKTDCMTETKKFRDSDKRVQSNSEVCGSLTVLDSKKRKYSISETNINRVSTFSNQRLGNVLENDCKKGKSLTYEDDNKLGRLREFFVDHKLSETRNSRYENEKTRNNNKSKIDDNIGNMKKSEGRNIGTAEIRKLSELVKDTNYKEIQSSNNESLKSLTGLKENLDYVIKENNVLLSDNLETSCEKLASEGMEKLIDTFFLNGDDSRYKNDSELKIKKEEWQFKKQHSFRKEHVLNERKCRTENGRIYEERSRREWLSDFCPEESGSLKEISRSVRGQESDGKTVTMNEMQKGLLALASSKECKPAVSVKSSFPSNGQQGVPAMNRKQRRLLERMSSGAAAGGTGGSEEHLHPSWEAKRKQKMQILPFQGKRVKFDDE